jgi:hypothetical protein
LPITPFTYPRSRKTRRKSRIYAARKTIAEYASRHHLDSIAPRSAKPAALQKGHFLHNYTATLEHDPNLPRRQSAMPGIQHASPLQFIAECQAPHLYHNMI